MFIDRMQALVESYLANDGVVQNDEYVQLLTEALQDGVQDFELQGARSLQEHWNAQLQQQAAVYQQAQLALQYAQMNANGQGTVINTRNPIPGLFGLVGVGAALHQVQKAREQVTQAERQYRAVEARVTAYQVIYNELRQRADWWTRLWN